MESLELELAFICRLFSVLTRGWSVCWLSPEIWKDHTYILSPCTLLTPVSDRPRHVEAPLILLGFSPSPPLSKSAEPSEEVRDGDPPLLIWPIPSIGMGNLVSIGLSFARNHLLTRSGRSGGERSRPTDRQGSWISIRSTVISEIFGRIWSTHGSQSIRSITCSCASCRPGLQGSRDYQYAKKKRRARNLVGDGAVYADQPPIQQAETAACIVCLHRPAWTR